MISANFDSTKTRLEELLVRCGTGKIPLPDFQRGWTWDDDRIRSLLKTALAARTNRQIGGRAPSHDLPAIEKAAGVGPEKMDEILRSHGISPGDLRADRFWPFFAARAEALLQRIEAATGKTIAREPDLFRAGTEPEAYDEGPEEWDVEVPLEEEAS